jgi:hypothetical protein
MSSHIAWPLLALEGADLLLDLAGEAGQTSLHMHLYSIGRSGYPWQIRPEPGPSARSCGYANAIGPGQPSAKKRDHGLAGYVQVGLCLFGGRPASHLQQLEVPLSDALGELHRERTVSFRAGADEGPGPSYLTSPPDR